MSDSRIERAWRELRATGRAGVVPYLTAGHPTPEISVDAIREAAARADVIEVGVPFSDPLADGPTIQASTFAALKQGMTMARTLELIDRAQVSTPVVLFSYLNPVMQYGVDRLIRDASAVGVSGILLTDLPTGGDASLEHQLLDSPLDLIRLVAPTSTPERIRTALANAQGFVYLVARLGVTGASHALATDLGESVARVRAATPLPIAVGFGISTAEQAREVAGLADGVVVGSALVTALEQGGVAAMTRLLEEIREGVATA